MFNSLPIEHFPMGAPSPAAFKRIPWPRHLKVLADLITKLDTEYDTLNEEMAKGETSSFGATCSTEKPIQ